MPALEAYGWDTVFAVRLPSFNKIIARDQQVQAINFPYSQAGDETPDSLLDCVIGVWSVTDVYGPQITLSAPISSGQITTPDGTIEFGGHVLSVTANFALHRAQDTGTTHVVQPLKSDSTGQVWAEASIAADPETLIFEQMVAVTDAFDAYFSTDKAFADMNKLFARLSMEVDDTVHHSAPLTPTSVGIAGALQDCGDPAIAVLAATGSDTFEDHSPALSPYALTTKTMDAAFLLSKGCFLRRLLVPGLPKIFSTPDATADTDFPLSAEATIFNANAITFPIKTEKGDIYHGKIEPRALSISLDDDRMTVTISKMSFDIDIGAMRIVTISLYYQEELLAHLEEPADKPGHKVLLLKSVQDPICEWDRDDFVWVTVGQLLIIASEAIVHALLSRFMIGKYLDRGATLLQARLMVALMSCVVSVLGSLISSIPDFLTTDLERNLGLLPNFNDMIAQATSSITWASDLELTLDSAAFSDGLSCQLTTKIA